MNIEHIVLSGGGIKGIALLGALNVLHEKQLLNNVKTYVGSSIGALVAALMCVGYTPIELYNVMSTLNPYEFKSIEPMKILTHFGFDSGCKIVQFLHTMICIKTGNSNLSFKELHERYGKTLIVTGTCLNTGQTEYFNHETAPDIDICDAVRLSISIPYMFSAVRYRDKIYVDGGILNNFPIDIMNDKENVLGIRLKSCDANTNNEIETLENFTIALVSCVINEIQKLRLDNSVHQNNVVYIDLKDVSSVQFNLTPEKRQEIYDIGQATMQEYILFKQQQEDVVEADGSEVHSQV